MEAPLNSLLVRTISGSPAFVYLSIVLYIFLDFFYVAFVLLCIYFQNEAE